MADQPGSLAEALAAFQAHLPAVVKSETATVQTKTGGSYRYSYADLAKVSNAVLPALGKVGLSFTAKPTVNSNGKLVLAYKLLHTSGEEDPGEYPLPQAGTPQELGSAITYARRYCLCSITGVAPDDDDDGAAASAAGRIDLEARRVRERAGPTAADALAGRATTQAGGERSEHARLLQQLHIRRNQLDGFAGTSDEARETFLVHVASIVGHEVTSTKDLTEDELETVITDLKRAKRAQGTRQRQRQRPLGEVAAEQSATLRTVTGQSQPASREETGY